MLVGRPWLGAGRGYYPVKSRARRRRRRRGTRRAGAAAASRAASSSGAAPSLFLTCCLRVPRTTRRWRIAPVLVCSSSTEWGLVMRCTDKTRGFCKSQWCFVKCRVLRSQRPRGAVAINDSQCAAKCACQLRRSWYYPVQARSQCDEWIIVNATRLFARSR